MFIASNIASPTLLTQEYQIGNISNTNYPVIINKEITVTHHTAILGVTGSGKSVFARNLINQIADGDTKVIIVDLTGEYKEKDSSLTSIVNDTYATEISKNIETLASELAKFANQRNQSVINTCETNIKKHFAKSIKDFLEGDLTKTIFELSDITNNAGALDYTRWFFWVLFKIAKTQKSYGKRVCVVLEEAHTVIPEISTMGASDNASKATVNSISQIALQGRKYNIGFIVIAQRTANVSKTVLTQCNSVICFQELDRTTSEFLSNYMGKDFINALPTLKPRTAIAMGKAFRSTTPMMFEVPIIDETKQ
jgi:DNA helicase HerA-like ATPase